MFGHLHADRKGNDFEKAENKKARELDYTLSKEKKVSGTMRHLTIHHHADKANERIIKRQAAIRMQAAYRARRAKQELHKKRIKNLLEVTQFDFTKKMNTKNEDHNMDPPKLSPDECCTIAHRALWESQRFVRDMSVDWWRQETQAANKAHTEQTQRRMEREWRTKATENLQETLDAKMNYILAVHGENDMTPDLLKTLTSHLNQARGDKDEESRWVPLNEASKLMREGLKMMQTAQQRRSSAVTTQEVQTDGTFEELANAWSVDQAFQAQQELAKEAEEGKNSLKNNDGSTRKNKKNSKQERAQRASAIAREKKMAFLPECFHDFVTVNQDHGRPMRKRILLAFIEEIYEEKMIYDEVDDRESHPRHGLAEFIHDHLFRRYGLRSLADHHLYDLVQSLIDHKEEKRVILFMRFLGMSQAEKQPLPKDALDFVLYCIAYMHTMSDGNGRPIINHSEGQSSRIPEQVAMSMAPVIVSILVQNGPPLVQRMGINPLKMMSRVRNLIKTNAHNNVIDYDVLLEILVVEFEWVWAQLREHLRSIFIKGDLNADGVLTLDEFTEILHTVSPGVSDNRIHRMFKSALAETQKEKNSEDHHVGVNVITPDGFVNIAQKYGFLSGDHRTYMPPRPISRRDSMELRVAAMDQVVHSTETAATASSATSSVTTAEASSASLSLPLEAEEVPKVDTQTEAEWKLKKEKLKSQRKLNRGSIHKSTHDLVLTKVKHMLAQGIVRFGDEHPKVREIHFLLRAYNRDISNRTAFHNLTRAVHTLGEMLDEPISVGEKVLAEDVQGVRMVDGVAVGEEKKGSVLQEEETDDMYDEEVVVVVNPDEIFSK